MFSVVKASILHKLNVVLIKITVEIVVEIVKITLKLHDNSKDLIYPT